MSEDGLAASDSEGAPEARPEPAPPAASPHGRPDLDELERKIDRGEYTVDLSRLVERLIGDVLGPLAHIK